MRKFVSPEARGDAPACLLSWPRPLVPSLPSPNSLFLRHEFPVDSGTPSRSIYVCCYIFSALSPDHSPHLAKIEQEVETCSRDILFATTSLLN